jgi:hypothetical protein
MKASAARLVRYGRMLCLEPSRDPFMRIRAHGRLGTGDYRLFEREFAQALRRRPPPVPVLLDLRGFQGWTPGAFLRDLIWDLRHRDSFSRIAVVGDAVWHLWLAVAGLPLFAARMQYFGAGEERRAREWLRRLASH